MWLCAPWFSAQPASAASISPPVLVKDTQPPLPPDATLGFIGRDVPLRLVVEEDGSVGEVSLLEPQGDLIDAVALSSAWKLSFRPALHEGVATRARIFFVMRVGPAPDPISVDAELRPPSTRSAISVEALLASETAQETEVTVTGTRVPERRDRSVISTQVITKEDIQRSGATTVAQALEAQPSLQMSRTFRGTELWIRGLDPEYTLVLVDGERVPGRIGGAIDLSRFPVETIEKIEIVRGPSSALYGSDAIGGVVNIITKRPTRPIEADADARIATKNASAGFGRLAVRPKEWWGASVSGSHQYTPAFRTEENDVATTGSEQTLDSAGTQISLGSDDAHSLRLSADYTRSRFEGVDANSGGAIFDRIQLQEQSMFSANHRFVSGSLYLQSVLQYSHFRDQYLVDQRDAIALDSYEQNLEHLGQITTTLAQEWTPRNRTTLGVELLTQIMDSPRLSGHGYRARYSTFAEHRWTLSNGKRGIFTLVPGARLDVDSQFGTQVSPKLALRLDPTENLVVRAGYGRGFRAPSFQELLLRFENHSVGYVVLGNPNLKAESAHGGDLSIEWKPGAAWFLSCAGFYNYLTDMISAATESEGAAQGTVFRYENIDHAWTRGVELLAVYAPADLLALNLGYTLMQTHNGELERPLVGRPIHRATTRLSSHVASLGLTFNFRGSLALLRPYFEDPDGDGTQELIYGDPLFEADLSVTKSFSRHFELYAGINNLANAGDIYAAITPRQGYAGVRGSY